MDNRNYSSEIITYAHEMAFLKSFGLRLKNPSGIVGRRVRFVGRVHGQKTVYVLDRPNQPRRPRRSMDSWVEPIVPLQRQLRDIDPQVRKLNDNWEIIVDFGDVRPQDEVWTDSALFIGSAGGITKLEGELRGDNIPEPVSCVLEINFQVEKRPMNRTDVEPYLDGC